MKTTTHVFVAVMALTTLFSCGQGRTSEQSTVGKEIGRLENELKNIDPEAKGGNSCLSGYAEKYDELLTKDMVAEASGTAADKMTFGHQKIHTESKYHDVTYSWKGSLKKDVGGMTFPMDDNVKLTGIEAISLNQFQMSYRAVSKDEATQIKKDMDEALDGNAENGVVNQAVKKLDEMGFSKEEQQKMVKDLTESARKLTEGFAKVDNLGDVAVWNAKTNSMYVFKDGTKFELVVELSDSGRNLGTATKLAQQILAKCK
ncbi:hypothetical protein FXV77_14300 [Sphingobacterium phlebotomi]|uniref:Lipoprotein n=1 Tax=Sphingobacterium phlebotomi TaxID=2605433 RepID=A0A5D4H4C9_9SPHI|nr:hypothetical protein [Sphingobacterium phlebotomi]TYR35113.1 hypothetical protein FXV77_14300 [Sphingobacterium phlebotomi]